MVFGVRVSAPGEGLVAEFAEGQGAWYADGWTAGRVADMLAESASVWRASQVYDGGVDALDEEQVATLEAAAEFFRLVACVERRESVDLDELTAIIARLSNAWNGAVLETAWKVAGDT